MTNETEPTTATDMPVVKPDYGKLNAHPPTLRRLRAISDPLQSYMEADRIARLCRTRGNDQHPRVLELRAERGAAVVALHRFHGWTKADIARHINAKDRRVVDYAFGKVDLRNIPEEWMQDETLAAEAARQTHAKYVRKEATGDTARELRRILIWELTNGKYGVLDGRLRDGNRYTSAHLAEIVGRTTALIAQNRTGSSNAKKKRDRRAAAEEKRRRKEAEAAAAAA